jgi:hypothetical protein
MRDTPPAFDTTSLETFDLVAFFSKPVRAEGLFEDRFGTVRRRFIVAMTGQMVGATFELHEDFIYDDGERQERVWRLITGRGGSFTATADDIIGVSRGVTRGNTISMTYRHKVMAEGRSMVLSFDDRFIKMTAQTAFSRARVSKWGIGVGEVLIFYRQVAEAVLDAEIDHRAAWTPHMPDRLVAMRGS